MKAPSSGSGFRNNQKANPANTNPRRDEQIRKRFEDRRPGPKAKKRTTTTRKPKTTTRKPKTTTPVDYYSVFEYSGEDYEEYSDYKPQEEDVVEESVEPVEETTVFAPIIINESSQLRLRV
jgi:hypothetical protein